MGNMLHGLLALPISSLARHPLDEKEWLTSARYLEEMSFIYWRCALRDRRRPEADAWDGESLARRFPEEFAEFRLGDANHTLRGMEAITQSEADKAGFVYLVPASRLECRGDSYGFFYEDGELAAIILGFCESLDWLRARGEAKQLRAACAHSQPPPTALSRSL